MPKSAQLLSTEDANEIYYVLGDEHAALMDKIGPDGENLTEGDGVELTPAEAEAIYWALISKRDAIESGFYDDYEGEIDDEDGDSREWADHLIDILATIGDKGENLL